MTFINRSWSYLRPASGPLHAGEHFRFDGESEEIDLNLVQLNAGLLVKVLAISLDPGLRASRMGGSVYAASWTVGQAPYSYSVAKVLRSDNANFKEGDIVYGDGISWSDYAVVSSTYCSKLEKLPTNFNLPWPSWLHLGMPAKTAFYGLKQARLKGGEKIFVSSAAGAVGSIVCQLALAQGLTVIASTGSIEKCHILREMGCQHVFNYKDVDVFAELDAHKPIQIYFDNVQGAQLDAFLAAADIGARIIACGQTAQLSQKARDGTIYTLKNMGLFIGKRLSMQGILVFDMTDKDIKEYQDTVLPLVQKGTLKLQEDVTIGLENAETAFLNMLEGAKPFIILREGGTMYYLSGVVDNQPLSSMSVEQENEALANLKPVNFEDLDIPFHPLPKSNDTVKVTLARAGHLSISAKYFLRDREEELFTPDHTFLIEKVLPSGETYRLLWDLGLRPKFTNETYAWLNDILKGVCKENVVDTLAREGIEPQSINAVAISHLHFDHLGDVATFPTSTQLILGPNAPSDSKELAEKLDVKVSALKKRKIRILSKDTDFTTKVGSFDALDYFKDGSLYILNSPGHTNHHISCLARISSDNHYLLLASDTCHHCSFIHSPHPIPFGLFKWEESNPKLSVMMEDPNEAYKSIGKTRRMEQEDNVCVIIAHDATVDAILSPDKDVVPILPSDFGRIKNRQIIL